MARIITNILVGILLGIMFAFMIFSSWNDSAIFDETAHIGAGYSYLTERDMRLNPEHPPLIKDLAALPLLFVNLNFPTDTEWWQHELNGQWGQGGAFLFDFGNNPDTILHLSRFPIIILALLFGIFLFAWVRSLYGNKTALLATFFYVFSPTLIAHSRYVTTDLAAAFAFFIGIVVFVRFLAKQTWKRLFFAGFVFGIAQLLKFSLFLLVPIYIVLVFVWLLVQEDVYSNDQSKQERFLRFIKKGTTLYLKLALLFFIGMITVWIVYTWHVWNYPQERQLSDTTELTRTFRVRQFVDLDLWLVEQKATRPLGQYLLGLMMVTQRTAGGNSAYFLGEVTAAGWPHYFPTLYFVKESLGFHLLTLTALILALMRIQRAREKSFLALRQWISDNFVIFASLFFLSFFWILTILNPLNIGIRHVMPTFPFIYMLTARQISLWTRRPTLDEQKGFKDYLHDLYHGLIAPLPKLFYLSLVLLWIAFSTIFAFPYYLSYYNALGGGIENGYWIATDSNYDWGQDLKRLRDIVQKNPDEKVYLNYFGGSTPHSGAQKYYLGEQFVPWFSSFGPPPSGSLFAVSANELMGRWATPTKGFPEHDPRETYSWLRDLEPFSRAGSSIFLYRIP